MSLPKELITQLSEAVKPNRFLDYREFLKAIYGFLKESQKRYSYLQFAEDFGFSKTNVLHLIIQGKRPLTSKSAEKIRNCLGLSGVEKKYFELMVRYQNARDPKDREDLFRQLIGMKSRTLSSAADRSQLEFFSEWYHPVIFEMTHFDAFRSDPKWIADQLQLRIRPEQARKSLQLLEALNLIYFDEALGRHCASEASISTGDEIASVAVIRYHQKLIEMGKESITRVRDDLRDISAITVSVSEDVAQKMKEEIRVFRKRMMAMAEESSSMDAVYQMNVQLFPLTKTKTGSE